METPYQIKANPNISHAQIICNPQRYSNNYVPQADKEKDVEIQKAFFNFTHYTKLINMKISQVGIQKSTVWKYSEKYEKWHFTEEKQEA